MLRMVQLVAVATVVGGALPAMAQNILTNPGFETGTFDGYVVNGNSSRIGVGAAGTFIDGTGAPFGRSEVAARSGQFGAFALVCQSRSPSEGCLDGPEALTLTQTLPLMPGLEYEVGLWVGALSAASGFSVSVQDGFFQLYVDGQVILPPSSFFVPGDGTFQRISASFNSGLRTSVNVTYALTGSGTARALMSADDLFVQVVPEPSIFVLLASGLTLVGGLALRRRKPRSTLARVPRYAH